MLPYSHLSLMNRIDSPQIWFIGRTLASQAGETGSTPAICFMKNTPKSMRDKNGGLVFIS